MKTIVLAIALMVGTGVTTYAQQEMSVNTPIESVAQQEEVFVKIAFDDLNDNVKAAITKLAEEYNIKELGYNVEKKLTKVSLISKADESESVVILDDEGKEVE